MKPSIIYGQSALKTDVHVIVLGKKSNAIKAGLTKSEAEQWQTWLNQDIKSVQFISKGNFKLVITVEEKKDLYKTREELRKQGHKILASLNKLKTKSVAVINASDISEAALLIAEGLALSNYQFIQYRGDSQKKENPLKSIRVIDPTVAKDAVKDLQILIDAMYMVRNLVNEPVNHLNSEGLAEAFVAAGQEAGFETTVFDKKKITELKMGGLLAVNQGSIDPPTFSIMEYRPENPINKAPIVLVGKGVVYDTGGLSLKPTGNSMDYMKCDMAGSATVMGAIYTAARMGLPLHIVALAPSTDNRPGGNAFAPGDIIRMYNGMTVEMLNSDAEGRMILADALAYASQYSPELVISVATLTGAAHRALGDHAIAYFSTADAATNRDLENSGSNVYERLVYFPLWDEYGEMIDSDIADMKNIGGVNAGHITAAKFLEKFTNYPYIHLDIAGLAYFHSSQNYRGKNATGIGLRLLVDFLKSRANESGA